MWWPGSRHIDKQRRLHPNQNDSCENAKGMKSRKNSKLEIRNSKQIQMIKKYKISNNLVSDFRFLDFGSECFVCFGFRYSDFGFCCIVQ